MNLKKAYLFTFYLMIPVLIITGSTLISSCKRKSERAYTLSGDTIKDGENLVRINCTKCHTLVPANLLTNDVWQFHTLPSMAGYFSIRAYMGNEYYKNPTDTGGLTLLEWQSIVAYYKKMAPVKLAPAPNQAVLINDWAGFTLKMPAKVVHPAFTTMVAIDPDNHKIFTSDYIYANLTEWSSDLKPVKSTEIPSSAVNVIFKKDASKNNHAILSCIGRMDPVDFPNGRVIDLNLDSKDSTNTAFLIGSDLPRPVQTLEADFNKDGLNDLAILGQGELKGGVYLMQQNKDHSYKQSEISNKPGAVQAVIGDFNNDGWQDIMVLFGSGDESLTLFLNDHKGGFTSKDLLRFPAVYGSTSFQLADIDHDGKPDLIYTCGYNFKDSRILKPYHGVYIYKNMGNWNFQQKWFYHINGCSKAIAADFDGDGDLDIITNAFFADLQNNPAESVVYFDQDKPFSFKPHAIPVSQYGRWLSMDVGDYNNDGKPDVILGSYSTGFIMQADLKPFWEKNIPFIVLQNNFKK